MFNEKTGSPIHDNQARRINRSIQREAEKRLVIHARGWKRRKTIKRAETQTHAELVVAVMLDKIRNGHEGGMLGH